MDADMTMRVAATEYAVAAPRAKEPSLTYVSSGGAADGFAQEMRSLALDLVLRLPEQELKESSSGADAFHTAEPSTFRLARSEDVAMICDFRLAQSIEYGDFAATDEACRVFRAETESYVRRTLNTRTFFALVERGGEVVSVSGLEVADRMPTIGAKGSERSATIVACYTPPQQRGRGYVGQMLSAWYSVAPLLGIDTLYLESRNDSLQHLMLDQGYDYVSDTYRIALCDTEVHAEAANSSILPPIACQY